MASFRQLRLTEIVKRLTPKSKVILKGLPPGFLDGLPPEDQRAVHALVGKRVKFNEHDEYGHAELQFKDKEEITHFIWVDPKFIEP